MQVKKPKNRSWSAKKLLDKCLVIDVSVTITLNKPKIAIIAV